ncbi:MAG: xanthine dehydrogenase family protein molybdopterin-binding subunit [Solirubrobacteraceae bacterium]
MIGASVTRREDVRVLRGQTQYVDDLERAGLGHVAFVRSPFAHAAITDVQVPAAGSTEGLIGVLTAADLTGRTRPFPVMTPEGAEVADEPHPILAEGEVRYVGQPVVALIARSRELAEDAAEEVRIEYEPLSVSISARESDLVLMRWAHRTGDVDEAFARARHVVTGRYALPRLAAVPMEPRGCLAEYDPAGDDLTVWASVQDTHRPLNQLAHILDRPKDRIRVIAPDVGGAFGSKGVIAPELATVAAAAIALGVPVKWTEDRFENLVACYQGRGIEGDLELALDGDGRILGLRARLWADLGGYLLTTTPIPPHTAATLITGCYEIPAADVVMTGTRTHRAPTGPYRGAGRPDATYMIEGLLDEGARALGIDRVQLRRRNLIRSFPHLTATGLQYDSGDYDRCLDLALELAGPQARADLTRPPGPGAQASGTGIALYVERAGGGWESAAITLEADGGFVVATSANAHGQGHETTFAQIAAERLQVGLPAIAIQFGDSATVPAGLGTFGSRSVAMAGSAIVVAADALIERAEALSSHLLGVDATLIDGAFTSAGATLTWNELAQAAVRTGSRPEGIEVGALRAEATFRSPNVFSSGAYVATVTIDPGTGALTVTGLVAVDDSGIVINPLLVHGQVLGGAVQALGECLTEEVRFDSSGQNTSASLLGYSLLTAAEIPPIVSGEVHSPSPLNPLGAKGAGEGGVVGTLAAVASAVTDALGGIHVDPPYTAEKLWRAMRR